MNAGIGRVVENRVAPGDYHVLAVMLPRAFAAAEPGQFVMLLPPARGFLLPRPFSILCFEARGGETWMEFLYTRVGVGTHMLADLQPGEDVQAVGPLGRGYDRTLPGRPVLVGGGRGVAPLVALSHALAREGKTPVHIVGARTKDLIYGPGRFADGPVHVLTEDGTAGERGLVTLALERELARGPAAVYACGPHAMLARVAEMCARAGAACEVSIESQMACGTGICRGCAVGVRDEVKPYRMVCSDGPVFDATFLCWDTLLGVH